MEEEKSNKKTMKIHEELSDLKITEIINPPRDIEKAEMRITPLFNSKKEKPNKD